MSVKTSIKKPIKELARVIVPSRYRYGYHLYKHAVKIHGYKINGEKTFDYIFHNRKRLEAVPILTKANQVVKLISCVDICPSDNDIFFYSIDCFKTLDMKYHIFDNYSVDYRCIVEGSLYEIKTKFSRIQSEFGNNEVKIIDSLENYVTRIRSIPEINDRWGECIAVIDSLFIRPAQSFFEALQRILFINQFVWQTQHKNIGLGHLDWLLLDLYEKDIKAGIISRDRAKEYIKNFFLVLHENYWFKSSSLMGDTGQIIVLGGVSADGKYSYSELTYLFIEAAKELKLPDPKVFLRCSVSMPEQLLHCAIDCIATGIGAPFLSNDDVVIPAIIQTGYEPEDAYSYCASACWEPLVLGVSCDQNNAQIFNFAKPFVDMLEKSDLNTLNSPESILKNYENFLSKYVYEMISPMTELQYEEDPFLSLFSETAADLDKDITRGGVKYSNIGLTSVGLATVVNSIINLKKLVFDEKRFSFEELNELRKNNFDSNNELLDEMKLSYPCFGSDDKQVVSLAKNIMCYTAMELSKYSTKYGGKFKIGLSSPSYVISGANTPATFDGRKNGAPFSTHISADRALPATELLSFASKLDYSGLKCNGNVVDFFVSPATLNANIEKYAILVRTAFAQGVFQMQMNVVSSSTLIAAREHPEQFPDLIVRVWGFSAYFKDLPDEYKDVLIQRAIESEKAA